MAVFEGKLPNAREVILISNALTLKYSAAFSKTLTGQDPTSEEDNHHLTPVWPYQEAWQLLYLVETSSKVIRGRQGAALVGKSREGCPIVKNAFLTAFQDPKKEIQLFWRSKSNWPWWIDSLIDDIHNIVKQYSMLVVLLRAPDSILSECKKLANMVASQSPNSVM
nr:hypothetical protein CFP56_12827 [Quercus suber]